MPGPKHRTMPRVSLSLLGWLGRIRRRWAAKSKSDSASGDEAALAGNTEVVQVTGVKVIYRPHLKSDVTPSPIINTATASYRDRGICQGAPGVDKSGIISTNQAVHEAGEAAAAIAKRVARSKHVREIFAVQTLSIAAIAKVVAADVCLNAQVMEQIDRGGKFPAFWESQPLSGRVGAGRQAKVEV